MVRSTAHRLGWHTWHFHDSRRQVTDHGRKRLVGDHAAAGFPDLTLAHPRFGIVFAELKTDKGKLTGLQQQSLDALAAAAVAVTMSTAATPARVLVHLWRPRDLATVVLPTLQGRPQPRVYGWTPGT